MIVKLRVTVTSVQNGETYSVHEFDVEAPTTLQVVHNFDDAVQAFAREHRPHCGVQNRAGWSCSRPKAHSGPHSWEGKAL